ncbi:MAG: LysR family transcriptional regulator [Anaerovoracaceae bacterium]|jgi:DNA-binding transcriptional LysR family regulator
MNNRHMKIFVEVYEKLSMTLAAEALFISQPSVSQAIKELEEYYGVRLFERYPKRLYPTPEGDLLYNYCQQILGLFDEAKKDILSISGKATISVGANISVGTVLIRKYIDKFHEKYPDVKIFVKVAGSSVLTDLLSRHKLDFALMEDLIFDSSLIQKPFYNDKIVFVCSKDNPLAEKKNIKFEDLRDEEFLLRNRGVGVRDKFDYLMKLHDIEVEPLWESANTRSLINAAEAGYGIAVLPYLLVKKEIDNGEIAQMDVEHEALTRNLNITYHKDKLFNKWIRDFIDIIESCEADQK